MANLTTPQLVQVAHDIWKEYSSELREVPINKANFLTLLTFMDNALEQAEIDVATQVPAGAAKDWLTANPEVPRRLLELVERQRRLNL